MLKLILSDYEADTVSRVQGKLLSLEDILNNYLTPERTKFTLNNTCSDKKRYTIVATNDRYAFAIKNYSTAKLNTKYWFVNIDLKLQQYTEFIIQAPMIRTDYNEFCNKLTNLEITAESLSNLPFTIDSGNDKYNNGEILIQPITDIDRVWFEFKRGESK